MGRGQIAAEAERSLRDKDMIAHDIDVASIKHKTASKAATPQRNFMRARLTVNFIAPNW